MRTINKVILIGNVTRDPEIRQTANGQKVVTFGLATNRVWITKDGRKQDAPEYHELVAWAKLGDMCEKFVRKGKLLYVEGYIKTRSWVTPEGMKKFRTEVVVEDLILLDKRKNGEEGADSTEAHEMIEMQSLTPQEENIPEDTMQSSSSSKAMDIDADLGL